MAKKRKRGLLFRLVKWVIVGLILKKLMNELGLGRGGDN